MPLKLEEEGGGVGFKLRLSIGREHQVIEELCIEESRIRLACFGAIPSLFRVGWDRDLFPDLEAYLKVFGDLIEIVTQLVGRRRSLEGGVVADGPKEWFAIEEILAVLAKAFPCKGGLGVLPLINLALPAFVGPGGSAKANQR